MLAKYILTLAVAFTFHVAANSQNDTIEIRMNEIEINSSSQVNPPSEVIGNLDKLLRPAASAQDLLRLVPGLFIAQHAGGGKAEQIFLRGFDSDHGTDFSLNLDGMPVNMVSHAHGQGYADFHFVIPETVEQLKVYKGTYNPEYGDFATSGAAEFSTKNKVQSMIKLEYGRFETYRAMAMIDLLKGKHLFSKHSENLYVAGEFNYVNSFLENKQHFSRKNIFAKYNGMLTPRNMITITGSHFNSGWDASGQIPQRAISEGQISRFGSIDPTEGGKTGRTNINIQLATELPRNTMFRNQLYYSYYDFNLYSNFTFYLHDRINGDQIYQQDKGRHIIGYKSVIERNYQIGERKLNTRAGGGIRADDSDLLLAHSVKREILDTINYGHLSQQNLYAFIDQTVEVIPKVTLNTSLRFDHFDFMYKHYNKQELTGNRSAMKISPKTSLYYTHSRRIQLFLKAGYGFHSNDARSVVLNNSAKTLPNALSSEIGSTFKAGSNIIVNAVLWGLDLQNELVYVGDEAVVEITGPTRRIGADLSLRWQLAEYLFADADLNYSYGRYKNLPNGENFIPLAPSLTSTGGLSYKKNTGLNTSLRYRYINSRPANESKSVTALGYCILDAVVNYSFKKFQAGITIENLFNKEWNQAQFDTESRLKDEAEAVSELHFTPGTPFFIKSTITFLF